MAENTLKARLLHAYKSESEWNSSNPILKKGEAGYISDSNTPNYGRYKIGDGVTKWNDLPWGDKKIWDEVDGIEIGGRNLIPNSKNANLKIKESSINVVINDDSCTITPKVISPSSWGSVYSNISLEKNQTYTFSAEISDINIESSNGYAVISVAKNPPNSGWNDYGIIRVTKIGRYYITFNTGDNTNVKICIGLLLASLNDYVVFKNLKLEKGNKATDWTPAPEDKADVSHIHSASDINSGTLATSILPIIPVSKGGTGLSSLTSGQVLIGNGTGNITTRAIDTTNGGTSGSTSLITSGAVYAGLAGKSNNHEHPYLPLSGGTMNGALNFANGTWNTVGDDVAIGDINIAGTLGIIGKNGNTSIRLVPYGASTTTGTNTPGVVWTCNDNASSTISGVLYGTFSGNLSGNSTSASKWQTARTLTIGNTGKSIDGSANVSWSLAEIGAVNKTGDTISGTLTLGSYVNESTTFTGGIKIHDLRNATINPGSFGSYNVNYYFDEATPDNTWKAIMHITGWTAGSYASHELAFNATNDAGHGDLYHRTGFNSAWQSWRKILDNGNYTGTLDGRYLKKSGDTMTGALKVNSTIFGYNYTNSHNAPAFIFDKPGSNYTGIGCNGETDTIFFSAVNTDYSWNTSYKQKWLFNGTIISEGGNINGNVSLLETKNILLRPGNTSYTSGIGYDTNGNECIALWAKNSVTRLRWYAGKDMSTMSAGTMMGITPDFEVSKASGSVVGYLAGQTILHSGNYSSYALPLSGGTMSGTAFISWPDSGNWGNSNSGVTFPVKRGGLSWSGQSDYIQRYSEETSNDNLNLVIQFGDDNSNGISIRNASNVQTAYISANGGFSGTFYGNSTTSTTAACLARSGDTSAPMTFYWSGQSGQPTWLWGGNDGSNMYVYNPSNFSVNHATTSDAVIGTYTGNGGQHNPNYFGRNRVGFLMMNTTVNGNAHYKDWIIMDCYGGDDVGGGVAFGVNRQALGAYIMRSDAARTAWAESAELLHTANWSSTINRTSLGAMAAINANGYYGMGRPDGNTTDWIRTTSNGILPYQSGSAGSGHCYIGTSSWYFYAAYIDNIYGTLNGNVNGTSQKSNYLNLLHGDEINFTNGSPSTIWFNYRSGDSGANSGNTAITQYKFCNRNASTTGVTLIADSFSGNAASSTTSNSLIFTGTGNNNLTAYQTSDSYMDSANGWASYIICNHGDGATYYNQTIRMPFWGIPQYSRLEGGTRKGWFNFITDENISSQSVNYASSAGNATSANYLATYASNGDNVEALKSIFDTVPKSVATAVRLQHGSHSMALGWFLEGYAKSNAYGGWFISDYGSPSWVGVDNGTWNTCSFLTSNNYSSYALPLSGGTLTGNLIIKRSTESSNAYGSANPTLSFYNSGASQNLSLVYSDYDSVQAPSSLTLIGNQGGEYFIAPNIKATSRFYGNLSYSYITDKPDMLNCLRMYGGTALDSKGTTSDSNAQYKAIAISTATAGTSGFSKALTDLPKGKYSVMIRMKITANSSSGNIIKVQAGDTNALKTFYVRPNMFTATGTYQTFGFTVDHNTTSFTANLSIGTALSGVTLTIDYLAIAPAFTAISSVA